MCSDAARAPLLALADHLVAGTVGLEAFVEAAERHVAHLELYPSQPILQLGAALAERVEKKPALAERLVFRLMASDVRQGRGLAAGMLRRLAWIQPVYWAETVRHLAQDEDWEVRDLAARVLDSSDGVEGAIALYRDSACEIVEQWTRDASENVRHAATQALLDSARGDAELRRRLLELLAPLREDESEYVRSGLVAALCRIGRVDAELVFAHLESWLQRASPRAREVIQSVLSHAFAHRFPERQAQLRARL